MNSQDTPHLGWLSIGARWRKNDSVLEGSRVIQYDLNQSRGIFARYRGACAFRIIHNLIIPIGMCPAHHFLSLHYILISGNAYSYLCRLFNKTVRFIGLRLHFGYLKKNSWKWALSLGSIFICVWNACKFFEIPGVKFFTHFSYDDRCFVTTLTKIMPCQASMWSCCMRHSSKCSIPALLLG